MLLVVTGTIGTCIHVDNVACGCLAGVKTAE